MKKLILLYLPFMLLLLSCSDMSDEYTGAVSSEEKEVALSLRSFMDSETSLPASDEEITELDLLIFKNGSFSYSRTAYYSKINKSFRSVLKVEENIDIYFFANCREVLKEEILTVGKDWQIMQEELILTSTDKVVNNTAFLPMWGQAKGVTISEHSVNQIQVQLLRAVAGVNVYFDLEENEGLSFEPEVMYVYYGADRGYIAPEEEILDIDEGVLLGVEKPQSPISMQTVKYETEYNLTQTSAFVDNIFLFENETSEQTGGENKRTRLVVGGYVNGSSTRTYFPLHFVFGGEVLPIIRNHQYKIKVKAVHSEGWNNPDEAAEAVGVNLDYDVIQWNDQDTEMAVDGPDYLSVSKREVTLYRNQNSTTSVRLWGSFKKENISLTFSSSHNGTPITNQDSIENERFKVNLEGTGTNLTLQITAKGEYSKTDQTSNHEVLVIKAGRIKFSINIEQITSLPWNDGGNQNVQF